MKKSVCILEWCSFKRDAVVAGSIPAQGRHALLAQLVEPSAYSSIPVSRGQITTLAFFFSFSSSSNTSAFVHSMQCSSSFLCAMSFSWAVLHSKDIASKWCGGRINMALGFLFSSRMWKDCNLQLISITNHTTWKRVHIKYALDACDQQLHIAWWSRVRRQRHRLSSAASISTRSFQCHYHCVIKCTMLTLQRMQTFSVVWCSEQPEYTFAA